MDQKTRQNLLDRAFERVVGSRLNQLDNGKKKTVQGTG